jgi:hypothetical protein
MSDQNPHIFNVETTKHSGLVVTRENRHNGRKIILTKVDTQELGELITRLLSNQAEMSYIEGQLVTMGFGTRPSPCGCGNCRDNEKGVL